MPVYQYEGLHYELPDGLSDEQAISKIKSHLGQSPVTTKPQSPLADVAKGTDEWMAGTGDALGGLVQAGAGMLAGMPSMIAGGLRGASSIVAGEGVDKAVQRMEDTIKSNFGAGQFKPWSKQGEESTKQLGKLMEAPKVIGGNVGEYIGGNEGRFAGEVIGDTLANFASPTAMYMGAKAGVKKFGKKPEVADKPQTTAEKIRAEAAAKEANKSIDPAQAPIDMRGVDLAGYDQVLREPGSFNPYDVGGYVSKSKKGVETTIDPEAQRTLFDEEISPTDVPRMEQPDLFSVEPPKPFELTAPEGNVPPMPPREVVKTRLDDPMLLERTPDGGLGEVRPVESQTLAPTTRDSASEKVANGQQFAMTAEERIYWEKTRKVIQEVSDGTKTLSNKEILNKIQDRAWVQDTIDKIKQRQEMFKEIEQRSQDRQAVRMAEKRREVLEDQLTALQEHLSAPRVDRSGKQQGPKTLAAKAGRLFDEGGGVTHLRSGLTKDDFMRAIAQLSNYISPKTIENLLAAPDWKSREKYVLMKPDEFLDLALKFGRGGPDIKRLNTIKTLFKGGSKIDPGTQTIPWLTLGNRKGTEFVTGHEGRHRATYFKERGVEYMPVILRSDRIRWDQQKEQRLFDYVENYPTKIATQDAQQKVAMYGDKYQVPSTLERPFPISRAQAGEGAQFAFNDVVELNSGLKPDWKKLFPTKLENALVASEDGTYIPNNPNTKVAIEKALEQGKDGKQWNMVQSGSTSVAMKSGSPIIKAASEIVQNALKRADLLIRNSIFPAEQRIKNLSRDDITTLAEVFKDEMKLGKRYDGDILANNFSVKQIEAYTEMRRMFDDALDAQNAARMAKGQDPIKPMEAYMASRWQGDFRRPIYEKTKDGQKLVWYLADNTRGGLEKQTKALLKDFPDLIVDPKKDHVVRSSSTKTELESMYTKMLDILGRDDPAIQKLQKAIEEQEVVRGAGALGQEKHFEKKAGIRGFVGDRPGTSPRQEAIAMFQQQIQYAKNAYRWSELQKAADDIKTITSDPRLQEQQPNNIKYIRDHFKNAMGMGEGTIARAVDDALRSGLGVSPTIINNAVGNIKSFFILQKLAASAGYTMANFVSLANVIPYLAQLMGAGYRGNPATSVLNGTLQGMAMATWHYARAAGAGKDIPLPNQFMRDAFAYAEDNGVVARSVYDESPIQASFGVVGGGANFAAKTMTMPESFVRSVAFMTYANMLKSSGKFTDNGKMFQMAEEYVNKSMVDYRETERPLMFAKAGAAGNFANTLQTYPISFYNQYAYMAKQAMEGNPWGLGAMLAVHYGVAGLMGIPGFDDADKIYKWLRDNALPTSDWGPGDKIPGWASLMQSPFMSDPKLWLMENAGKSAVYGALSENTGLGLTSRVAAPGAGAMLQSPAGPITDLGKQAYNLGKAVVDPTDKAKWAQVGMGSLPVGMQGLLETADFMEDYTFVTRPDGKKVFMKTTDLADRKGGYARTPEEVQMRKFGLRSQKEVVERDVSYATSSNLQTQAKKSGELIDRYYSAVRQGNVEEARKLSRLYIELTGKEEGIRDVDIENQIKEEFMTDVERSKSAINTVNKAKAIARMNAILEKR